MTQTHIPRKSQKIIELAKKLGAKGAVRVPERLWGYGKIEYSEEDCIGCGKCEDNCSEDAIRFERTFDLKKVFEKDVSTNESKKNRIMYLITTLAVKKPKNSVLVPELVHGYGTVIIDKDKCIGCGNCERNCSGNALHVKKVLNVG